MTDEVKPAIAPPTTSTLGGPTSAQHALVMGGALVVIDGRGVPWSYVGTKGPTGADAAFVLNHKLIVISGGVAWSYNFSDDTWTEGIAVNEPVEGQPEGDWQYGPPVETKKPAPEEPAPIPTSRKKAKEPA